MPASRIQPSLAGGVVDILVSFLVWDNGNRLVGVDDATDASKSQVYGYDSLDRLTSADIGSWGGAHTFDYDAVGNRTSLTDTVTNDGWQYAYGLAHNRLDQRWSVTGGTPGTPLPMSYDAMGNLVNDGLGMSLAYDVTGRLTTATKSAAQFSAGTNALGQRVTKMSTGTSAAGTRLYARDETGRPLGVYVVDAGASNGYRVEEEYVHLDSWRPVAVVRPDTATGMANPKLFPILTDHLGAPRKVLDGDTGETRWAWDAKQPFGHELPNETPTAGLPAFTLDLRFPGQRFDEETGLFHNGFRDYHPGLGRYVQSDPLGLEAGWNTFAYGNSNPLSLTDPTGLIVHFDSSTDPIGSQRLQNAVSKMEAGSPIFKGSMDQLRRSKNHYFFVPSASPDTGGNSFQPRQDKSGKNIGYYRNIHFSPYDKVTCNIPTQYIVHPFAGIAHEVSHAVNFDNLLYKKTPIPEHKYFGIYKPEEIESVRYEAMVSRELGVRSRGMLYNSSFWLWLEYNYSTHHKPKK